MNSKLIERLKARRQHHADIFNEAAEALSSAETKLAAAEKALEPFAKFRIEGFTGPVIECGIPNPDNPSPRIEGIFTNHFREAARVHAMLKGERDE
jgi:hypothetical protein